MVPGRAFLRRLINLTIGIKCHWHFILLTAQAKLDLQARLLFLQKFNGKAFFLSDQWIADQTLHLYTDASGSLGYGAVLDKEFFFFW